MKKYAPLYYTKKTRSFDSECRRLVTTDDTTAIVAPSYHHRRRFYLVHVPGTDRLIFVLSLIHI